MTNDASLLRPRCYSFLVTITLIRVAMAGMPEPAATDTTLAVLATLTEVVAAQQCTLVVLLAVGTAVPLDQESTSSTGELAELKRVFG